MLERYKPKTQQNVKKAINTMFAAISQGEGFRSARYIILRAVAAFPLDVNVSSESPAVHHALGGDRNALAGCFGER